MKPFEWQQRALDSTGRVILAQSRRGGGKTWLTQAWLAEGVKAGQRSLLVVTANCAKIKDFQENMAPLIELESVYNGLTESLVYSNGSVLRFVWKIDNLEFLMGLSLNRIAVDGGILPSHELIVSLRRRLNPTDGRMLITCYPLFDEVASAPDIPNPYLPHVNWDSAPMILGADV